MGAGRERCELVVKAVWVVHILPYFCLPPCSKGILGTGMVDTRRAAVGGQWLEQRRSRLRRSWLRWQ